MIVDSFPFFNELDILDARLHELDSVVDKFILVEASKTQSLLDKSFYYEDNKERFKKFHDKIIHIKVSDHPQNDTDLWNMEHFQRNCVMRGLEQLNITNEDWIMISDLDEIPKAESVQKAIKDEHLSKLPVFAFDNDFYAYFLNLKSTERTWVGTSIFRPFLLTHYSIQNIKDSKNNYYKVPNAGWHLSYMGGGEKIYEKFLSCIEPLDKSKLVSLGQFKEFFNEFIKNPSKNFIHSDNLSLKGMDLQICGMDNHPEYIKSHPEIYNQYILN